MKRVLFIDRDGTLIIEPPDEQIDSLEKLEFYPGVFSAMSRIAGSGGYEIVIITNQDGLGTSSFPEQNFWPAHEKMMRTFENEGIVFNKVFIDRSFLHENKPTRKPGTGLLSEFMSGDYDLANSFVIGDRLTDVELAKNLGAKAILVGSPEKIDAVDKAALRSYCVLLTTSWKEIANLLLQNSRAVNHHRKTNETSVAIRLNPDGTGISSISTGLGFFDHMLEQLSRHGLLDLAIETKGDLHIDEHHTIEDTAIALGEAFTKSLGDKRGMERYGFCLPMDDCLAQVALDFGGRSWLEWEASFKREKIGDMPTEMFFHFFKSFSDAARCNLNIKATGENEHHKIESIFKAFARAIKMAVRKDGTDALPSTKGTL
ncbi:MAG TPA: bifunctional histidinol-phosphatase/imidazoleglycerol-phosphate dehydratase HisB [Cyclobacteriaceae bacterium]|nr:bifunctional histidinol-phosphatase/imidazoleglycerol-phosphate dehydratase HisB [Cyclobacteriaceae bacterium]